MLKIGIVGAGVMGNRHEGRIADYGAQVVAVHDIHLPAAQELGTKAGAKIVTDDLERFFEAEMDGLIITTPPPVRVEPIRGACERGIHLMIEKPPALNMTEARACLAHIENAGVIDAVSFQLRYGSIYERLKELLADETVHLVHTVCTVDYYLNFRMSPWFLQRQISGGPLAEQAIHILDCARFIMGNVKPVRANAIGAKNMALDRTEFDAENAIQMMYELDNGVFGTHMNHCGTKGNGFELEVIGPQLRLRADAQGGRNGDRIIGHLHGNEFNEPVPPENSIGLDKIHAWLRAIETGDRSLIRSDFGDAMHTLALIEAAIKSQDTGGFVKIDSIPDPVG